MMAKRKVKMSTVTSLEFQLATMVLLETESSPGEAELLAEELMRGRYDVILRHDAIRRFLDVTSGADWLSNLAENVTAYLTRDDVVLTQDVRELYALVAAVAALLVFVQNNYVGPPNDLDLAPQCAELRERAVNELRVDGEPIYHLAVSVEMLALAKVILLDCKQCFQHRQTAALWALRCVQLQQTLLEERSPTLKDIALSLISSMKTSTSFLEKDKNKEVQIQFHLEAGHLLYFYYEAEKAADHFREAQKLTGLKVQLTGMLGKRTRFQQKDITQLVLEVSRGEEDATDASTSKALGCWNVFDCVTQVAWLVDRREIMGCQMGLFTNEGGGDCLRGARAVSKLPANVALDDDTVLEAIQLQDDREPLVTRLSPTEQALLLGLLYHHRKVHEGHGDIIREETLAFVNSVLEEPQNWCVQTQALLKRTEMEQDSTRRMQRSLTQFEELVAQFRKEDPPVCDRISHVFCTAMPMHAHIQKKSAKLLMTIGSISSALEIYLKLEMWEEVIRCYSALGRREKAEKVIRDELYKEQTPSLYCHLGDVTDDPEYYTRAWELSGGRFSRAQRCLALYYLRKCEFETSLEHFAKTLELNTLQVGVWFSYGCAAMACEKYELAATAFRRCVNLETENFEAWSNLATAYIRSNQKPRAFKALKEALKCEYENWRLWENYLIVSTDVGEFEEVLKAYHRMIDLKEKYAESDVLKILVRAVNENLPDANDRPSAHLRPKVQELFGRITSKVTTSADIWRLYAELLHGDVAASCDVKQRAVQYLQKAHRCMTQAPGWERDIAKCQQVATESAALAKVYVEAAGREADDTRAGQVLAGARLMLKAVLAKLQNPHRDPVTGDLPADVAALCGDLDTHLQLIERTISDRKAAS